jgi:hypothetical protein
MTRIIISLTRFIVNAVVTILFAACTSNRVGITGSGKIVTENRSISEPITSVGAASGLEVIIIQSPEISVVVEADDNLQQHIITEVKDGVLRIKTDDVGFFNSTKAKVTVHLPVIKQIDANSGSSVKSGNIIKSTELVVISSSGSSLNVEAEADHIVAESSLGSTITLKGKALKLETSSSSGSQNDARELHANDVESQSSSGSTTYVRPILSLDADASSGSSIVYLGSPKHIAREESSGGSVSAK